MLFRREPGLTARFLELKDTHLGPLTSSFTRSSSTSTIIPEGEKAPSSLSDHGIGGLTLTNTFLKGPGIDRDGPAASEAVSNPPAPPSRPGILIVTLHEGRGFSLPADQQHLLGQHGTNSASLGGSGGFSVAGSMRPTSSSARGPGSVASSFSGGGRPQSVTGGINAFPTNHGRYSSKYLPYALLDFDKVQVFVNAVSGSPENPLWAGDNTSYKFDVSRVTEMSVQIYLRNPSAKPGSGRSEDILLGQCRVNPRFEEARAHAEDLKANRKDKEKAQQDRSLGQSGSEWLDMLLGTGQIKIGVEYVENRQKALKIEDFELLKVVGKGSFGKVMQVM